MVLDETKKEVLVEVQIGIILGILFFMGLFCFWECEALHCNFWFWIYFIFVHVKEGMGAHVWVCSERENVLKNF